MLIQLIRNRPNGQAITGRLVIDGRWFCDTLERVGYQIPALCYPVKVTQSPKFKRLLPLVCNVPQRSGIRFHRGSQPKHSTGCILTLGDNKIKTTQTHASIARDRSSVCEIRTCASAGKFNKDNLDNLRGNQLPAALEVNNSQARRVVLISLRSNDLEYGAAQRFLSRHTPRTIAHSCTSLLSSNTSPRTSADVEQALTSLILKAQNNHETIILEVTDYRPGTPLGYDTPCPPELQMP